jgi:hypothetical protein
MYDNTRIPLNSSYNEQRFKQKLWRMKNALKNRAFYDIKGAIHSQLNWAILLCDVIPDGKTE